MNDGGSTLGENQTGSGGTDALNSANPEISPGNTSPTTPSSTPAPSSQTTPPNTPLTSPNPDPTNSEDEHTAILLPSSGPARLFGQDISGITDEDLSSPVATRPISTTIFPGSMSTPEPTPSTESTNQPSDPTFNGVPTAQTATPSATQTATQPEPTPPPIPAQPATPPVPYEQQFLEQLHTDPNATQPKDDKDIILDPTAGARKMRKGLIFGIIACAIVAIVLAVVAVLAYTDSKSNLTANSTAISTPAQAFYSYANKVLYGTDSTSPITEERDYHLYAYNDEIFTDDGVNLEYLDQISQQYSNFYDRLQASGVTSGRLYDITKEYKDLLDFLKINPSGDDFDRSHIAKIYLSQGESAAKREINKVLSQIPEDNNYGEPFKRYKKAEFDSTLDYMDWLTESDCIVDGAVDESCIIPTDDPYIDDKSVPQLILQASAHANNLIEGAYLRVGKSCWDIKLYLERT